MPNDAKIQPSPRRVGQLSASLLAWSRANRRDLPWRSTRDPYAIWVSEVMLQQTRVSTVVPYYARFLERFPSVHCLAEAPVGDVFACWSGLGYYRRARLLHRGAGEIRDRGGLPSTREQWLGVSGVGDYTAGAVASIAFGQAVGAVDGNVARVLARWFAIDDDMKGAGLRRARILADALVPSAAPGDWNQALMELGATVCTPSDPACGACPVRALCQAYLQGRVHELPWSTRATPPVERTLQAFVVRAGRRVLVTRRTSELYFGMWEPPWLEQGQECLAEVSARFGVMLTRVAGFTHVLSHRRLHVEVHTGRARARSAFSWLPTGYDAARWVDGSQFAELGHTALARKILESTGFGDAWSHS